MDATPAPPTPLVPAITPSPARLGVDFLATSTASLAANMATHPLESIKVYQMVVDRTSNTWSAFRSIVRASGWASLYKGAPAAMLRGVVNGGGRLTGYTALKQLGANHGWITTDGGASEMPVRAAMATVAASVSVWLAAPLDLVRTRQSAAIGPFVGSPSMWRVARDAVQEGGVTGLFAGSTALITRAAAFNVAQLLTYDECKALCQRQLGLPPSHILVHVTGALGAGVLATTVSAPLENVKTIMQMSGGGRHGTTGSGRAPPGLGRVCLFMWQSGGVRVFFRGWMPLYAKTAPHTLVVFVVMEHMRNLLGIETNV